MINSKNKGFVYKSLILVLATIFSYSVTNSIVVSNITLCRLFMNEKDKKELMFILPRLKRYCYGLTGNKDQGDDLLHSSVVKILSKFNLLKIENLQAYMYKIISNLWKDELRKKYKTKEIHMEDYIINQVPDNNVNYDKVSYISSHDKINQAINSLTLKLREVLILIVLEKKSYKEVSEILQIPIGTVMSRLHESRRKLLENNDQNKLQNKIYDKN